MSIAHETSKTLNEQAKLTPKGSSKRTNKAKMSRRKEIIKTRVQINEIEYPPKKI